ncbi:MAG: hypothetical protein JSR78_07385 [Proteobacteria bacterium]|nr:hypothetical protein [Pseudomonadota bacterium]
MALTCRRPECTVAQTGICVLNNATDKCPELNGALADVVSEGLPPVLEEPIPVSARFPGSGTLAPSELSEITAKSDSRIIGIIGTPDAGKTAAVVSLYLLISRSRLEGFEFADSKTLMAFEDISRGARRWNANNPPTQMTSHTQSRNDRQPGYLHLRLAVEGHGTSMHVLFPDVPGEWTTALIENNRVDRLEYIRSSDDIWLVVNGRALVDVNNRLKAMNEVGLLVRRLKAMLGTFAGKLVVTHLDAETVSADTLEKITKDAAQQGVTLEVHQIASFGTGGKVKAGQGLAPLLRASLTNRPRDKSPFWSTADRLPGRAFWSYRGAP